MRGFRDGMHSPRTSLNLFAGHSSSDGVDRMDNFVTSCRKATQKSV